MKIKDEMKDSTEKQWGAAGRLYQQTHLDNGNLATNVSNKNENKVKNTDTNTKKNTDTNTNTYRYIYEYT